MTQTTRTGATEDDSVSAVSLVPPASLEALLERTLDALVALDAETAEALVERLGEPEVARMVLPRTPAEWRRAAARHRVLGRLLGSTARRMAVLRTVSESAHGFPAYGPGGDWLRPASGPGRRPWLSGGGEC